LVKDLGITGKVEFCGNLARNEVWEEMRRAKGLFFSSVRDTSGNVVLEAMSLECPVLCLNHQGSAAMTDETCALRVQPGPWDETVEGFAAALRRLEHEPELVSALGQAGRERVLKQFRWDRKLEVMNEIYASVMGGSDHQSSAKAPQQFRHSQLKHD
jgi:glycosyltransferase involved in cell wall biosynthesis